MSFCAVKAKVMSTAIETPVARSADSRKVDGTYLAFTLDKFPGFEKLWTKIQSLTAPGKIQIAGNLKNTEIAAELVASEFAQVYMTPTMNMGALAEGFHHWFCYCSRPKGRKIQRVFIDLTDPYADFKEGDFNDREGLSLFNSMCDWQLQSSPSCGENFKRAKYTKDELSKLVHEYDQWNLKSSMGMMKLFQFMVVCIYAHNLYTETISQSVVDKDSMPMSINLGKKRAHAEPMDQPRHERQMNPYSVLIQSTSVNVRFVLRSEDKFLTKDKKNQVYKYSGSIHRKGADAEKFSQLTLTELREMTGLSFTSLTSKKTPVNGETLFANDTLQSKLTILAGDIEGMLQQFAGDLKAEIGNVNENVLTVNENLIAGLACLRENDKKIMTKLDQLKEGTLADSLSFGMESNEEVLRLREELANKEQIIRQKDELIALLMKQLNERK